jgi:GlpG protein
MREIGTVPNARDAQRLADYLLTLGIRSRVDAKEDGSSIWVYDEDQRERGRLELEQFLIAPSDARYEQATQQARRLEREAAAREKRYSKNVIDMRDRWDTGRLGRRPVTMSLVAISCGVALIYGFGNSAEGIVRLSELWFRIPVVADGHVLGFAPLSATLQGQLWRLVTPIFIHMFPMHLLFNMFATIDLGSQVELRLGTWRMLAMVLLIAIVSNVSQNWWVGPNFGGMSGVAYGLFGYIWIRSRTDPTSGFFMHPTTVMVMMLWLILCYVGFFGSVANAAHTGGLAMGAALAFAPTIWRRLNL